MILKFKQFHWTSSPNSIPFLIDTHGAHDGFGDFNDLMLAGTLCGVEMGLEAAGVPYNKGGVNAAMDYLNNHTGGAGKMEPARAAAS